MYVSIGQYDDAIAHAFSRPLEVPLLATNKQAKAYVTRLPTDKKETA